MKIQKFESFKDWLLSKPNFLKSGDEFKYIDNSGETRYCKFVRDDVVKGEMSLLGGLLGGQAICVIDDEKYGRITIEKNKLIPLTPEEISAKKYNL